MSKKIIFILSFLLPMIASQAQTFGKITDKRDNKTYKTVKIGNQTWMAENLAYKSKDSKVYNDDEANAEKYGRLYIYDDVHECPSGWRCPTLADFEALLSNYGGAGNSSYEPLLEGGSSGFSAKKAGWYYTRFMDLERDGYFWSSTFGGRADGWVLYFGSRRNSTRLYENNARSYFSIRCIKD